MHANGAFLEQLTRDQCLRRMADVAVGRIVYTRLAMPAVELVNFAIVDGDIVIRTSKSGKLAAAIAGAVVAFEVDQLDIGAQSGWSVTAVGESREVTDPVDLERLNRIGLNTWAPGDHAHYIRISPQILNGRMIRTGKR
ncbi:MAG TPA: pyridoxamine 5'-phosphate oxidase family protein [Streptosporangiaceae bacterium]|nr:pyridoxamine 5'-phosphate oxidase family protein [Streptosporangiaceae bacterium]